MAKNNNGNGDDDAVGYGRPPRHSQFKPGQSGNPRGRRKGSRGLKTDLHTELATKFSIQINGKPIKGTKQQLMLKALATRAATGDVKAASLLLPLILQVFGIEDRGADKAQLSSADEALLQQLLADLDVSDVASIPGDERKADDEGGAGEGKPEND